MLGHPKYEECASCEQSHSLPLPPVGLRSVMAMLLPPVRVSADRKAFVINAIRSNVSF